MIYFRYSEACNRKLHTWYQSIYPYVFSGLLEVTLNKYYTSWYLFRYLFLWILRPICVVYIYIKRRITKYARAPNLIKIDAVFGVEKHWTTINKHTNSKTLFWAQKTEKLYFRNKLIIPLLIQHIRLTYLIWSRYAYKSNVFNVITLCIQD